MLDINPMQEPGSGGVLKSDTKLVVLSFDSSSKQSELRSEGKLNTIVQVMGGGDSNVGLVVNLGTNSKILAKIVLGGNSELSSLLPNSPSELGSEFKAAVNLVEETGTEFTSIVGEGMDGVIRGDTSKCKGGSLELVGVDVELGLNTEQPLFTSSNTSKSKNWASLESQVGVDLQELPSSRCSDI